MAELERQITERFQGAIDRHRQVIWEQLSDAEHEAMLASLERRELPGYVLTAEDKAIEQRWGEAVCAVVPEHERASLEGQEWALAWCEAVKKHG